MEGDLTSSGEQTIECTDDVYKTCIILFTGVTPINSIKYLKLNK